ncbi:beta-lactamase-like protein [Syncephalis plumigaleata]|nr:beta-lactamase-like protein [Syncephalis plumigaleata]
MAALTPLPDIEMLSKRVIRVLGLNPGPFTLQGTNTYLVGTGAKRLLIDTGEGVDGYVAQLKQALKENSTDNSSETTIIDRVLLTHWHRDHVGGLSDVCKAFSNLESTAYKFPDDEHDGKPATSSRPGVPTVEGTHNHTLKPVKDGDVFHTDSCTLRALHTPGHTRDHLAFYLEEEQALFTGDCVLGEKTTVFEDLPVYLESLERLKRVNAKRIYPGHGPMIDGEDNVQAVLDNYIKHRIAREEEIIKLMEQPASEVSQYDEEPSSWTASQMVSTIYPDVPDMVKAAAGYGLLLHLLKLKHDGRDYPVYL